MIRKIQQARKASVLLQTTLIAGALRAGCPMQSASQESQLTITFEYKGSVEIMRQLESGGGSADEAGLDRQ